MLPCVCSVIDHRWRQNVARTKKWHTRRSRVCPWCSYHILASSVIYYWIRLTTTWKPFVLFLYCIQNICIYIRPITEKSFPLFPDFLQSQVTELISIGRFLAEFGTKWKILTISKKLIKLARSAICIYTHSHTQSLLRLTNNQEASESGKFSLETTKYQTSSWTAHA